MLSINKSRSYAKIISYDYVKPMQILKKFANNFFH